MRAASFKGWTWVRASCCLLCLIWMLTCYRYYACWGCGLRIYNHSPSSIWTMLNLRLLLPVWYIRKFEVFYPHWLGLHVTALKAAKHLKLIMLSFFTTMSRILNVTEGGWYCYTSPHFTKVGQSTDTNSILLATILNNLWNNMCRVPQSSQILYRELEGVRR